MTTYEDINAKAKEIFGGTDLQWRGLDGYSRTAFRLAAAEILKKNEAKGNLGK